MPAITKWFTKSSDDRKVSLNGSYLSRFGATIVPLEITNRGKFARIENSLSFFLECVKASTSTFVAPRSRYFSSYIPGARAVKRKNAATSDTFFSSTALTPPTAQVYLAQAPLASMPQALSKDVPVPSYVLGAGKGDVYDSSIWLGHSPTYTPLHRDPNPNLFVQLAGTKRIRLFTPEMGRIIFARVQEKIGGTSSPTMRGEEMMQGAEKSALEDEVWNPTDLNVCQCYEAQLASGDGLFIPKGWWHSVKGTGERMNGSVNWWFR